MVTTTRATSDVPGATGRRFYGPGENEHLFVWRGPLRTKNMPCILYIKPGHTFAPGERTMDPHTSSTPALGYATDYIYERLGWPIVSIDITPPFSADSPKREPFSKRPFPGSVLSLIRAIRYLREHAKDETLWGTDGSISPSMIAVMGSSSGHTMAMLSALIPPAALDSSQISLGARMQYDHRPSAVIGTIGQVDWTQFALDPNNEDVLTGLSGVFRYDFMQYFHGLNGSLANTTLAEAVKRSASPWYWLPHLEAGRTAFWQQWGTRPSSGDGSDLTPDDWSPGVIQSDTANNKCFFDPHHYFQARPWHNAVLQRGCRSRTLWGDVTENNSGTAISYFPTAESRAEDIYSWLRRTLGWPVVYSSV